MPSVSEELERLFALFEKGAITREQFESKRDRLMAEDEAASVRSTSASSPGVPNQVGAYRILGHIGDGGMGAVYRGEHRSPEIASRQGGAVAVKVMHPHIARNESFAERFEREAGLGLKLDHPGICKVHELIVDGGVLALVMEIVDGEPLSEIIGTRTGPIPWARAWPMFAQLLESVAYMHGAGVLHRDIKPENVLVTEDGKLKVLDLGIAKDVGSGKTKTGVGMGTVDYMAPEQHTDAGKVDERADVYALGMTLYEMLAGRLPWGETLDPLMVLQKKLSGQIPPPTDFYPDIADEVVAALMGALATERDDRTSSAAALGTALEGASAQALKRQAREAEGARQRAEQQARAAALAAGASRPSPAPGAAPPPSPAPSSAVPPPQSGGGLGKPVLAGLGLLGLVLGVGALVMLSREPDVEEQAPDESSEESTEESPPPGTTTVDSKTGIELAYIPAGTFTMGSPAGERGRGDDETQHQVTLSQPFWMGTTEVTNAQYRRFVEATGHREPKYWDDLAYNAPNQPVVRVSWNDAVAYASWAGMSLPTEAQWEYAARAGTTTTWWSGDSESDLARVGWYDGNSDDSLHAVGEKPANAWGLHDVHGNVWEWTADWYGDYPGSSQTDPTGPGSGSYRVARGGSCFSGAGLTRVAFRYYDVPDYRPHNLGFRLSRTIP